MTNLILCGGVGARLWPLSSNLVPKQFLRLWGDQSLFQQTVERNRPLVQNSVIAGNAAQMAMALEQWSALTASPARLVIEPVGRNTAPSVALCCLGLPKDELVLLSPSDHLMSRPEEYYRAVARAAELAAQGFLVAFGIQPTSAETGFGYIETEGETVLSFREKPDEPTATRFVESGRYLWNSGIYVFRAGDMVAEMERFCPDVVVACRAVGGDQPTLEQMGAMPSISIDYAVMERSEKLKVVVCQPGWSDVGSFDTLYASADKDGNENVSLGTGSPLLIDATGNLVVASSRRVVLLDVDDLVVVDTPEALLVTRRGHGQRVREVVARLHEEDAGGLE